MPSTISSPTGSLMLSALQVPREGGEGVAFEYAIFYLERLPFTAMQRDGVRFAVVSLPAGATEKGANTFNQCGGLGASPTPAINRYPQRCTSGRGGGGGGADRLAGCGGVRRRRFGRGSVRDAVHPGPDRGGRPPPPPDACSTGPRTRPRPRGPGPPDQARRRRRGRGSEARIGLRAYCCDTSHGTTDCTVGVRGEGS